MVIENSSAKHWRYFLLLRLLRCFTSAGLLFRNLYSESSQFYRDRLPHSEIPGSKVARHLTEAYRSYATSFIVVLRQGIHHTPLLILYLKKLSNSAQEKILRGGHIKFLSFFPVQSCLSLPTHQLSFLHQTLTLN